MIDKILIQVGEDWHKSTPYEGDDCCGTCSLKALCDNLSALADFCKANFNLKSHFAPAEAQDFMEMAREVSDE